MNKKIISWKRIIIERYACGAALKSEPNQGSADDSAANGLRLIFCKLDDWKNQNIVTAIEGLWGTWAPTVMCPVGEFIAGFKVKYETKYNGDNSALNGISFVCQEPFSDLVRVVPQVVFEGLWGNWSQTIYTSYYLHKGLIKDVTAKWQPAQCGGFLGSCDDTQNPKSSQMGFQVPWFVYNLFRG